MLVDAFQRITGMNHEFSSWFVGFSLFGLMILVACFAVTFYVDFSWEWLHRSEKPARPGSLQGVPPEDQYRVPYAGHPDCGDKACELRGCAIIGTCQAPRTSP